MGPRFATPETRVTLTDKGAATAEALCLVHQPACSWRNTDYDGIVAELKNVNIKSIGPLYSYAVGWLANLQATSSDWTAVAELPWVQAVLERTLELDESYEHGAVPRLPRAS